MYDGEKVQLARIEGDDFIYVLKGEVLVSTPDGATRTLKAVGAGEAPFLMPEDARFIMLQALEESTIYHVDRAKLDYLFFWNEMLETVSPEEVELRRRLKLVSNSLAFRAVPAHCLLAAIERMQPIDVSAGTEVAACRQACDGLYLFESGQAQVWMEDPYSGDPELVRTLGPGDTFGERAMVTGEKSDATLRIMSDSHLLMLTRDDFQSLVSKPMIKEVDPSLAKSMLDSGYGLLDVRMDFEFEVGHIPGSQLIPLHQLHDRATELVTGKPYVVYCKSGNRSAVASLMLKQRGVDAFSMKGGISDWPYETEGV